ncbi:MAG: poly-gamma-glutamate synthase PgsB/CapB [Phenylobacterium sp.]|jgi:poly-gamma-glutamate synthase PgsB/CapB
MTNPSSSPLPSTPFSAQALLELNLSDNWLRLRAGLFERLQSNFTDWHLENDEWGEIGEQNWQIIQLIQFLQHQVDQWLDEVAAQQQHFNEFSQKYHRAAKEQERNEHMINIAQTLDYSKIALQKIRRNRALWFDESAIYDRHIQKLAAKEQDIASTLQRLGDIVEHLLSQVDALMAGQLWTILSLHKTLQRPLEYHGNVHIRTQAFQCLSKALKVLPNEVNHQVPANIIQYIYRNCLDDSVDIWLRSEAITLVAYLDPSQLVEIINRLFIAKPNSDMYLRGRVVKLICQHHHQFADFQTLIDKICLDPSDYVRQRLAEYSLIIAQAKRWPVLQQLLDGDKCAQVRAQVYLTLAECFKAADGNVASVEKMQLAALGIESDHFALRALMHTLPISVLTLDLTVEPNQKYAQHLIVQLTAQLNQINQRHENVGVRRWASQTREHLWSINQQLQPPDQMLPADIVAQLQQLPLHKTLTFSVPLGLSDETLHRQLARIGGERFGFDIEHRGKGGKKVKVRAGFRFGFRFWRFWHEFRHPATDKRQDHNHLKGRLYYGMSQTSSQRMAELSATTVPGEPLFVADEQGWRDYLPLLDQVISSLDQGWPTKAVKIYSTEGITEVLPPANIGRRLYARMVIQMRFAQIAKLRNWREADSRPASDYLQQLSKLGFTVTIRGYLDERQQPHPVDPKVQRFFAKGAAVPTGAAAIALPFTLPGLGDMQNYFYSVYQNTIVQLMAFTGLVSAGYLGNHIVKLAKMRHHRQQIPLVVGGWGTRGKSGTERLKAALFNAMGLSVLSKTTGCEAMFLYGPANRPMKELFLFRPYDKATIWEQVFLTGLTAKLGADVFLWECMGLTPRYIDIIQNQWMRDDISTITNCYPDHEDLQGPAGIEIPIVMQRFVPNKSVMLTTEESMLPLLQDAALAKQTEITCVTWLDAGLLTDDVVGRFPYEEHPNNIALVAQMARSLDVETDFALKEMADNVVADLGVLKIYPLAHVQQRRIEFINGMSANERLGAMGNWQRTGLSEHTLADNPEIYTVIVINNRADRIARSKVFATMLINDTQADCYCFIGANLSGFASYIEEAWASYKTSIRGSFTLSPENQDSEAVINRLTIQAQKFRIPISEAQVLARIRASVEGLVCDGELRKRLLTDLPAELPAELPHSINSDWTMTAIEGIDSAAIERLFKQDAAQYRQYAEFKQQFAAGSVDGIESKVLDWLFSCIKSKWVMVDDYYSSGNQTINTLVQHIPPGLTTRVIGMQNIKGTGLDFIYRWQAWNTVHRYCDILCQRREEEVLEDTAKALSTWEEFGLLDQEKVRQMLTVARQRPEAQKEILQAQFRLIEQRLDKQLGAINNSVSSTSPSSIAQSKVVTVIIDGIEAFLDSGDAIKRRKKADNIYQALLDYLISYDKASVELAKLTKAQKGGWLGERIKRRLDR